jgi:hypothetical protein
MFKYFMASALALVCTISMAQADAFSLSSKAIKADATLSAAQVYNGFGCSGANTSPDLSWSAGPSGTKSYAITVYDPDAPTGSGWWHWLVYNIPADTHSLASGAGREDSTTLPINAQQGRSDFGSYSFGGACPPEGDKAHRYIFTVYALKTQKIDLPKDASAALIGFMLHANTLAKASFTAKYAR